MKIRKPPPVNLLIPVVKNTIDDIRKSNINIEEQLAKLMNLYLEKINIDELKEKQFEIMVDELQRYKSNFIFDTVQKRMFYDLIGVYNNIEDFLGLDLDQMTKEDLIQYLGSFKKQIIQVLSNHGVDLIEPPTSKFDPKIQEAVSTVPAESPEEDMIVERVISQGFTFESRKLLKPQKVSVKKYSTQTKKEV